jgi:hypothetical protein
MKKIRFFSILLIFLLSSGNYFAITSNAATNANNNKFSNEAQNLNSAIDNS